MKAYSHRCNRCGLDWKSNDPAPLRCGCCGTPYWNRPRKKGMEVVGRSLTVGPVQRYEAELAKANNKHQR